MVVSIIDFVGNKVSIPSLMGRLLGWDDEDGSGCCDFCLNTLADGQAPRMTRFNPRAADILLVSIPSLMGRLLG